MADSKAWRYDPPPPTCKWCRCDTEGSQTTLGTTLNLETKWFCNVCGMSYTTSQYGKTWAERNKKTNRW
eukprot:g40593.t1